MRLHEPMPSSVYEGLFYFEGGDRMSSALEAKKQIVQEISERFEKSKSTIITEYKGLTVAEMNELRKQLREAGVEYAVLKNTLIRRATAQVNLTELDEHLVGPTAIAFSNEDVVAPAKVLHTFAKEHENLKIKGGVIEGNITSVEEIKALADLPSREGLLSMLASILQAPIRNLALAVKAVAEQDEAPAENPEA